MIGKKKLIILIILIIAATFAVWVTVAEYNLVTIRLVKENNRLFAAGRLEADEYVSLSYRHSVELTRVEGRFKLIDGPILAAWQTRQASVGTGLPNAYPERTTFEDGFMIIDEQMRPLDGFRFFIVAINKPELKIGLRKIELQKLKSGSLIDISAERVSILRYLMYRMADQS